MPTHEVIGAVTYAHGRDNPNTNPNVEHKGMGTERVIPLSHLTPQHIDRGKEEHDVAETPKMPLSHLTPQDREFATAIAIDTKDMDSKATTKANTSSKSQSKNSVRVDMTTTAPLGVPQSTSTSKNKFDLAVFSVNENNKPKPTEIGSATRKMSCKNGNNPFKDVPPDSFVPPSNAKDEDLQRWRSEAAALTSRISRLKVGGQELRDAITREVAALDALRLSLFCHLLEDQEGTP